MRDLDFLPLDWEDDAIEGMRKPFVRAFRLRAGPGSTRLAEHAWLVWRAGLREGCGSQLAEAAALRAAKHRLPLFTRRWSRFWIGEASVEHALRHAVRQASDAR